MDGEVLQVALLLPDKIRERWKDLVDELSAYYKTPGRLADEGGGGHTRTWTTWGTVVSVSPVDSLDMG